MDLAQLNQYLEVTFGHLTQRRVQNELFKSVERLVAYPGLGRSIATLIGEDAPPLCFYRLKKVTIFYEVSGDDLLVIRIISNRQDINQLIAAFTQPEI
mgnify:FL=1